jgi:hypothetical protein
MVVPFGDQSQYSTWEVHGENLSHAAEKAFLGEDSGKYTMEGIEIKSRILSGLKDLFVEDGRPKTCELHQISYEEEIAAVLEALRKEFCEFHPQNGQKMHYLFPNSSCGFHVHVGNAGRFFEIPDLKNVLCMAITCDRLIDSIHATHRIGWTAIGSSSLRTRSPSQAEYGQGYSEDLEVSNRPLSEALILATYTRFQRVYGVDVDRGLSPPSLLGMQHYPERLFGSSEPELEAAAYG